MNILIGPRAPAATVGELVNSYFDRYPAEHKDQLKRRLQDGDDLKHVSAFFELALHELFLK